jgi:hypothetical protein
MDSRLRGDDVLTVEKVDALPQRTQSNRRYAAIHR